MEVNTSAFHAFLRLSDLRLRSCWDKNYLYVNKLHSDTAQVFQSHIKMICYCFVLFASGAAGRWRKQMRRKQFITLNVPQSTVENVEISCSCCLKDNPAKMGETLLLPKKHSLYSLLIHCNSNSMFYCNRDPYVIAIRSVTVATVPPEENSIRSEAKCAGFLIHGISHSTCKVPPVFSEALLSIKTAFESESHCSCRCLTTTR